MRSPTFVELGKGALNEICGRLKIEMKKHSFIFKFNFLSNLLFNIIKTLKLKLCLGKTKSIQRLIIGLSFLIVQCSHKPSEVSRDPSSADRNLSAPYEFETCDNSKKLYLETQMQSMGSEYFISHDKEYEKKIPLKCIQFAQRNFSGHYGLCTKEDAKPKISKRKPCLTENYSMLVYNAYHDVMDCFNLDPRDYFLQIMIESGFHINAFNKSGMDSGISQFTASGIKKVIANNQVEKVRRVLLESSRPSCQRISNVVGPFSIDAFTVQKRCSMISLPENPYRALLFNYLHMMADQLQLEKSLSDLPDIKNALTDKIIHQFTYLAYNRGITGLKQRLVKYVNSRKFFSQIITEDDLNLNKNLNRAKEILYAEPAKRELLKRAKVKNLSFAEFAVIHNASYVSDMVEAYDYVQRHLGISCGEL